MSDQLSRNELLALTTDIVAAHISHNTTAINDLPQLIQQVFQALDAVDSKHHTATSRPEPAVPINESVADDFIICLEDGKKLQVLKRYLERVHNMTTDQYKERWGLPRDYPVVSPNYTQRRSQIAKTTGLGVKGRRHKIAV